MDDRELERTLRQILERLGVEIRNEPLETGIGGFCKLEKEPIVVLATDASRRQRIDVFLKSLRQIDTSGIFIPPTIRDILEDEDGPNHNQQTRDRHNI